MLVIIRVQVSSSPATAGVRATERHSDSTRRSPGLRPTIPNNYWLSIAALLVAGYTAAALASAATTTFVVGGDDGWTMGVDYIAWVKGKTFVIGDKLVFNYPSKEHTVTEVGKTDYFACAGGNALSNDRSGSTNVTLAGPGTRYFICNIPGHCPTGMKLAVTVAGDDGGSPPGAATPTGDAAGATLRRAMASFFIVTVTAGAAMINLALP